MEVSRLQMNIVESGKSLLMEAKKALYVLLYVKRGPGSNVLKRRG